MDESCSPAPESVHSTPPTTIPHEAIFTQPDVISIDNATVHFPPGMNEDPVEAEAGHVPLGPPTQDVDETKTGSVRFMIWPWGGGNPKSTYRDVAMPSDVALKGIRLVEERAGTEGKLMVWGSRANWILGNVSDAKISVTNQTRSVLDTANNEFLAAPLAEFRFLKGVVPVFVWVKEERPRPLGYCLPPLHKKTYKYVLDFLRRDNVDLGAGWMFWNLALFERRLQPLDRRSSVRGDAMNET
ncbi:uncharacterized protein BXZ73DRAFT_108348 [Epithele typhae]|uniref:uncharacterized protein n=1 Tax=Epithele typhae TaxID=378194 RepID=UPI002007FCE2|nr:uncharacterized protein BXZ73DRAFT_108348 [Epithele typhae]KAH9910922.1 hypothetical protein BXZ73DRAFT_108348 [Epithele typhae]